MHNFIVVVQIILGLLVSGIFFASLLWAMGREQSWPLTLVWILGCAAIVPTATLIGYGLGTLYSVEDGHQAGMMGFGGAGAVLGLFLFLHRATSTRAYRNRTGAESKDFPVTGRIVICIAVASLAAAIIATPLFLFPFPDGVQRLFLAGPFIASWLGLFAGCAIESRARSYGNKKT